MGDVYLVYEPWSTRAIEGRAVVGITESWVYPQLALVPMVLAQGFAWIAGYEVAWAILVTLCDAAGVRDAGRPRPVDRAASSAAWFWLAFIALLGPVGMYRLDAITVPLALAGSLWLVGRPWLASILLAVATWIKVWPAALLVAAVIAVRRRFTVIAGAALVSVLTLAAVFAGGGIAHAFGFVTDQADRGLQLEAPVSAWYLWRAVLGIPGSFIYYDRDILTFQVTGPGVAGGRRRHDAPAHRRRGRPSPRSARSRRGGARASCACSRRSRSRSCSRSSCSTRSGRRST